MYQSLIVEFDPDTHVATATMNRPTALNAIDEAVLTDFGNLWNWAREDIAVHAVVLRGAAESRAFSSGLDLRGPNRVVRHPNVFVNRSVHERLSPKLHMMYKPVIAAVHGICAGAGQFLINECDISICSDDAQFFDPHLAIGGASAMGPIAMSRLVNLSEVLRYILLSSAERLTAETALRIGLVTEITTRENLWPRAQELAQIVAGWDSVAVQGTLRAIWDGLELGRKSALERAHLYSDASRASGAGEFRPFAKASYTLR